jgi:hypothetical protein
LVLAAGWKARGMIQREETKDILKHGAFGALPLTGGVLTMDAMLTAASILFIVLQGAYLIRKWWREETDYGLKMKRWANGEFTQPADLTPSRKEKR